MQVRVGRYLNWCKNHIFHFIIIALLGVSFGVSSAQQTLIWTLKSDLDNMPHKIESSDLLIKDLIQREVLHLNSKINSNNEQVNARIDIIDSGIKPDKKRRLLISKIRDAIGDNVSREIGARDLNNIANAVIDYSYEWNLTIPQVLAQIQTESNFDTNAVSSVGAQGLMQIMPKTLKYIEYEMPKSPPNLKAFNIYHNIRAGCFYMDEQIKRLNWDLTQHRVVHSHLECFLL